MVETKLSLQNVTRDDWLRLRKSGLGGSDAGAVCGLNPYSSPLQVFCDKTTEEVQDHDNESMRQGRDLEEYVAKRFMEETGKKVRRSNFMYRFRNAKLPMPTMQTNGKMAKSPLTTLSSAATIWL